MPVVTDVLFRLVWFLDSLIEVSWVGYTLRLYFFSEPSSVLLPWDLCARSLQDVYTGIFV